MTKGVHLLRFQLSSRQFPEGKNEHVMGGECGPWAYSRRTYLERQLMCLSISYKKTINKYTDRLDSYQLETEFAIYNLYPTVAIKLGLISF